MKKIGGKLKVLFCLKRGMAFIELNPGLARKT